MVTIMYPITLFQLSAIFHHKFHGFSTIVTICYQLIGQLPIQLPLTLRLKLSTIRAPSIPTAKSLSRFEQNYEARSFKISLWLHESEPPKMSFLK